jgi:hypothetical protein
LAPGKKLFSTQAFSYNKGGHQNLIANLKLFRNRILLGARPQGQAGRGLEVRLVRTIRDRTDGKSSDLGKNGSACSAQNRTFFTLSAYLAIPFARWGAMPHIVYPVPFPEALVEDSVDDEAKPKTPVHPLKQAFEWQAMLTANPALNRADIARINGISRARVTQVMKLLELDESIQERIKSLSNPNQLRFFSEHKLRTFGRIPSPAEQQSTFLKLLNEIQSR